MASVVPTILASNPTDFADRLKRVKPFARRIHIDIADGYFAPSKTINLAQAYAFDDVEVDLHLMIQHPEQQLDTIISLHPHLVIWHFEAEADSDKLLTELAPLGIKTGLGILPQTSVETVSEIVTRYDHALVFTGDLGYNGGDMKTECLSKIKTIKDLKSSIEVGVDGGVNLETAKLAIEAGADVLNSGGFIHSAPNPKATYTHLCQIAGAKL